MSTGILLRKGNKSFFNTDNVSSGELVFSTDTKEIGFVVQNTLVWEQWEDINHSVTSNACFSSSKPDGAITYSKENSKILKSQTFVDPNDGSKSDINWSKSPSERPTEIHIQTLNAERESKSTTLLGIDTYNIPQDYQPSDEFSIIKESDVVSGVNNAVKVDGTSRSTVDYENAPSNSLITVDNLSENAEDIIKNNSKGTKFWKNGSIVIENDLVTIRNG